MLPLLSLGVIYLVPMHKGGMGFKQKRKSCVEGEKGVDISKKVHESPFLHILCNIFKCKVL